MSEFETKKATASVSKFLASIPDPQRRAEAKRVAAMMRRVTGTRARMWGSSIVGFGSYHYVYTSGREGDWMLTGFSPRKAALTLYVLSEFSAHESLMTRLGKYKTGKACLYLRRLSDVDEEILERLVEKSVAQLRKMYPAR